MIKAEIRWNGDDQATTVKVTASGKTLDLGKEFVEFIVQFAKQLNNTIPNFGTFCSNEACKILGGDGGEKAPAPVTPIKPVN